jgi:hypothetical protein
MAEKNKANTTKPILFVGIALLTLGCALGATSLAWFVQPQTTKEVSGMTGEAIGSYFDHGNGTESDPYAIKTSQQLYYFNWLQDLGKFNEQDSSGNYKQVYFELLNDIDASGKILPPAGTTTYPFIGNFNGGGYKISNLTISNNETDLKTTGWPSGADDKVSGNMSIVGFFGIIGEYEGDAEVSGYTVDVNKVQDLYFDDLKIETCTDSTLVGLIAGYVNGNIEDCGVRKGYFDFQKSGVSVISSGALSGNDKLSQYSLIGAYNSNHFSYSGKPSSGGSGTDNDWGGSIDIASLAKRINFIAKNADSCSYYYSSKYPTYSSSVFNSYIYYGSNNPTSYFNWDSSSQNGQYAALAEGTYLPLNIDLQTATISVTDSTTLGSYYENKAAEPVLSTNTGYIVGRNSRGSATPRLHNKYCNSSATGPTYSLNITDQSGTISNADSDSDGIFDIFSNDSISFFYIDSLTGTTYRIKDEENENKSWSTTAGSLKDVSECGFSDLQQGYYNVKHKFAEMLNSANTSTLLGNSQINLNGIQLYCGNSTSASLTTTECANVTINGKKYDAYSMLAGGINFTLKEAGSIKIVLGTYISGTDQCFMSSLYQVFRSDDQKTIQSQKKITGIYKLTENGKDTYYQQDSENSATIPSEATKFLDLEALDNSDNPPLKLLCAYYLEIPLSAGNYWLGPDVYKNKNPYIMYLDIGANASGSGDTPSTDESLPAIDFVYYEDASKKTIKKIDSTKEVADDSSSASSGATKLVSDYTPSKVTFAISGSPTQVYFWRVVTTDTDNTEKIIVYYVATGNVTPTGTGNKDDSKGKDDYTSA